MLLQQADGQGECTSGFSVVLLVQVSGVLLSHAWLVGVAVVVELCVSVVGWYGHEGVRCAFWHRYSSLASRASAQAASA